MRSHAKASSAGQTQRRAPGLGRFALVCLALLGLLAFLGIGAPSAGAVDTCPNVVFRTGPSSKLPECRAYELVTPAYTGGLPTAFEYGVGEFPHIFPTKVVTDSGDDVLFHTVGGAISGTGGTGFIDGYRAKRTAGGWVSELDTVRGDQAEGGFPSGAAPEHDYFFIDAINPTASLWAPWAGRFFAAFLHTPSGFEPLGRGSLGDDPRAKGRLITPGASHVIFTSKQKLEPNAPPPGTEAIYDRSPGGATEVVSLLPGGNAPTLNSNFVFATDDASEVAFEVSRDGTGHTNESPLYLRRRGANTTASVLRPNGIEVGKEVECSGGPETATLSYQWLHNGTLISGAESPTYTIAAQDEGTMVQCRVTATDANGTTVNSSDPRIVPPFPVSPPYEFPGDIFVTQAGQEEHISTAQVGDSLECHRHPFALQEGTPTIAYQWLKDGQVIGGANSSTYTPVAGDADHTLQCRATLSSEGVSEVRETAPIAVQPLIPRASADPAISNVSSPGDSTPAVGDELSCSTGTWSGSPSFAYQWLHNGEAIAGAGAATYTVAASDEEKTVQCAVTATNADGSTQAISNRMAVGPASSAQTHPFLETFGSAAQPTFGNDEGLAIDQSTGDLLVIDSGAGTVSRWNPDGTPAPFSALGSNAIDGVGPEDGGAGALSFAGANEVQIAVDNSGGATDGDIYVTQEGEHWVDVFASSGKFLGKLTQYKEGVPDATGAPANFGEICGVAVDPSGAVYVSDYNGYVHKYVAAANPVVNEDSTKNFTSTEPCTLAAGAGPSAGSIFVDSYGGTMSKLNSSTGAVEIASVTTGARTASVDPSSGHVYAVKSSEFAELDASGASATVVSTTAASGPQGLAVRGSSGNVYVSTTAGENVSVYGPAVALQAPEQTTAGSVTGDPRVGSTLSCTTGTWSEGPTFTYQWLRNGAEISGANSSEYTLSGEDLGKVVQCEVTASNAAGSTVAVNADAGAIYASPVAPAAAASVPASVPFSGYAFAGIYGGNLFYSDRFTSANGEFIQRPADLYSYDTATGARTAITHNSNDSSFVNISADGSRVYFVSKSALTGSEQNQYGDAAVPPASGTGTISEGSEVISALSTSEGTFQPGMAISGNGIPSGTTIVSVGSGTLTLSKAATASGAVSLSGSAANLYVWSRQGDSTAFIATVSNEDVTSPGGNQQAGLTTWFKFNNRGAMGSVSQIGPAIDHSRSTADGTVFAFESTAPITPFDNTEASAKDCGAQDLEFHPIAGQPCDEVYRFDAAANELICVSCGPGGGPATGNARLQSIHSLFGEVSPLPTWTPVASLTEDGNTLFFESTEALLPQDVNGAKDVYRWKKGEGLALISTGQSQGDSALYGVTPDGSNAFIATTQPLLPQDENGSLIRLYDARVDGGFPPPESTVTEPCAGDTCQGAPSATPDSPNVASSSLNGGGNVAAKPHCAKGRRSVTRNGKQRCVKRHHRRHGRHKAGSKRGASR